MTATDLKEWLLAVSGSITLLSLAVSSWLALKQYRIKLKEEERLSVSARTETDIKLVKAFSELMDLAHGRSGHVLSEKTVEFLLAHDFVPHTEMSNPLQSPRDLRPRRYLHCQWAGLLRKQHSLQLLPLARGTKYFETSRARGLRA